MPSTQMMVLMVHMCRTNGFRVDAPVSMSQYTLDHRAFLTGLKNKVEANVTMFPCSVNSLKKTQL